MRYVFGEFVLDCGSRQLLKAGHAVAMGPKPFELLDLLLRSRPKALSRTRLRAALWPRTHVGQTSLHVLVSQVRAAIDDDAERERWIRTVHGFGYAFGGSVSEERGEDVGAPVEEARAGPTPFRLVADESSITLAEGENVLGREIGLPARIDARGVSRRHARIVVHADEAVLEDLGSKNGTFVQGARLSSPRVLEDGDVIRLGKRVELVFAREDATTSTEG